MKRIVLAFLRSYHHISFFGWFQFPGLVRSGCRFHPTCSEFCIESIETKGIVLGMWAGLQRLIRCNPLFS